MSARGLEKQNPPGYVLPSLNQGQPYILTYFLPMHLQPRCNQAHPVQLEQPALFTEAKTRGLLSFT